MTPSCLMLDVDGVLISGRPSDGHFWTHTLLEDLGIVPADLVTTFFHTRWTDVVTGKQDLRPSLEHSLRALGSTVPAETLISYWFAQDSRIVQPVLEDLRAARRDGWTVYLATNQDHYRATFLMETLNLQTEVDGIITSAQAGVQKPDPAFYSFAEQVSGHAPETILFVDDTAQNVQAARTAGWQAVHWTSTKCLADVLNQHSANGAR